jgi:DnaJ-class molecular chaperone
MAKSYFAILGISPDSTAAEIRSAYRRLAKEYHPDGYAGDSKRFRQIQEAYTVLGENRTRRQHEQRLAKPSAIAVPKQAVHSRPEPLIPNKQKGTFKSATPLRSVHSLSPTPDRLFEWLWDNYSSLSQPRHDRASELTYEATLSLHQARRGGNLKVIVPVRAVCPTCAGYGAVGFYACQRCAGEGAVTGELPVSISFPPGIKSGHSVQIPLDRFGMPHAHLTLHFRVAD